MTATITAAQRDALYGAILNRLSGIGDLWQAVEAEDFARATSLGWEYADSLRLVLDDLGWGAHAAGDLELTAPRDVLRRIFTALGEGAAAERSLHEAEWIEARAPAEQNRLVVEACETVLQSLAD